MAIHGNNMGHALYDREEMCGGLCPFVHALGICKKDPQGILRLRLFDFGIFDRNMDNMVAGGCRKKIRA
eukprot:scaffold24014_cov228-Amphora_coffeaeformis.AAC.1